MDHKPLNLSDLLKSVKNMKDSNEMFQNKKLKINFLRNYTIENIEPYLEYAIYSLGFLPEITFGSYNNIVQEVLNKDSHIYVQEPDIIVLSWILDEIIHDYEICEWNVDTEWNKILQILEVLRNSTKSMIILNSFIVPMLLWEKIGLLYKDELYYKIQQMNNKLKDYSKKYSTKFYLIDFNELLLDIGIQNAIDLRFWYISKAPFKHDFLWLFSKSIIKIIKSSMGVMKKCIVLDCDNTLWGGIIGEDGLTGIRLDKNDYPGKVYYDFQKTIVSLDDKGTIIALCSKNNENDVFEVLDKHPHCILKRSHISSFKINWSDKVTNILAIAKELNIGLDSMVFIDDTIMECEYVSKNIPELTVLQVPNKLYLLPQMLLKEGLFDNSTISKEDMKRTQMYREEKERLQIKNQFNNLEEYLKSLSLVATIKHAECEDILRIAQLTQKTNQFNLTTRRYKEEEIRLFINDSNYKVFTLTAKDKYGEYGLTGIMILNKTDLTCNIDILLLSCRVLGRNLEYVFFSECLEIAATSWNIEKWRAEYIPTKKNVQVTDFYEKVGFEIMKIDKENKIYSMLEKNRQLIEIDYIKVVK